MDKILRSIDFHNLNVYNPPFSTVWAWKGACNSGSHVGFSFSPSFSHLSFPHFPKESHIFTHLKSYCSELFGA